MKPVEFFHTSSAKEVLRRAAIAAGVPVSLHYTAREEEGLRVFGTGSCRACRYVSSLRDGRLACRESREEAAVPAMRRKKPVPFVCPIGFACVAMSALPDEDPGFVLTFGPYCPAEAAEGLEATACKALEERYKVRVKKFPTPLSDIRRMPSDAVPAIAEWASETLSGLWATMDEAMPAEAVPGEAASRGGPAHRRRGKAPRADPYHATEIAAALTGGNQTQARSVIRAVLGESRAQKRVAQDVRRARVIAVVAATLEALERTGIDTAPSWQGLGECIRQVQGARTLKDLTDAAMNVLAGVSRKAKRRKAAGARYEAIHEFVAGRIAKGVTLTDVATGLSVHPTAITHHLQRKFGMSFSEYVGRLRVDKAKELLRRTRLSVGAVARRVGIDDASNFGKLFKKFENRTPLEYRSACRNK